MNPSRTSQYFHIFGRFILILALVWGCICVRPQSAQAEVRQTDSVLTSTVGDLGLDTGQCPDITGSSVCLMSSSGVVYFSRDALEPAPIASLTKIMTAIVALEHCDLDQLLTVPEEALVGGSTSGLMVGDTADLETFLACMLVPSGNDASMAIAYCVGQMLPGYDGTPESAYSLFIQEMNDTAERLGCSNTYFTNPSGLDFDEFASDAHSCAYDVAIMVAYAMEDETFRRIVGGGSTSVVVENEGYTRSLYLETTDQLLEEYEGACGVKTGTTDAAGYCFAGAVNKDGAEFYAVVLDAASADARFDDCATLFDWVFDNIEVVRLINSTISTTYAGQSVPLVALVAHTDWVDVTVPATVKNPDISAEVFTLTGNVSQEISYATVTGDVRAGDVVGSVTFYQNGQILATSELIATEDVDAPGFLQSLGVTLQRIWCGIQGKPTVAQSAFYNSLSQFSDR